MSAPNRKEATEAAKRLRMQRKELLREHLSTEARVWLNNWKKNAPQPE